MADFLASSTLEKKSNVFQNRIELHYGRTYTILYFTFLQSIYSIKIQFIHLEYIYIYKHEQMLLGRKKLYRFSWSTIGKNLKKCYENFVLYGASPKLGQNIDFDNIIKECNPSVHPLILEYFSIYSPLFSGGKYFIFIFTA